MDVLNHTLFQIGDSSITFFTLIVFALILLLTITLSIGIRRLLTKKIFPKYHIAPGIARAYSRIIYYIIFVTGLLIAINSAGINISILFAGGAALLVGIGFGIQNITNNFVSGLILLFERPIKEGDFIEVDGILGTVVSISARSTKIRTNTDVMIIVPNSKFLENNIINRSYIEKTWIDIPVNIAYGTEFAKVSDLLIRIAKEHPKILHDPEPTVSIFEFSDSFIKVKLWVCITENKSFAIIRSDILKMILEIFKKEGIEFPKPLRDVQLQNSVI
jgi:small-conductance mechanosensitive channel